MRPLLLLLLWLFTTTGCRRNDLSVPPSGPASAAGKILLRYGVFHGECYGYCRFQITVDTTSVILLMDSFSRFNDPEHPDSVRRGTITPAEWRELLSLTDLAAVGTLDSVYGHPFSGDFEGEFLEVTAGALRKSVTRSPGVSVPAIDALMAKLGEIQIRMAQRGR